MVAKYYGKEYSAEMLRRHCHITRNGVSMLGISEAAGYLGFRTKGVRVEVWKSSILPLRPIVQSLLNLHHLMIGCKYICVTLWYCEQLTFTTL